MHFLLSKLRCAPAARCDSLRGFPSAGWVEWAVLRRGWVCSSEVRRYLELSSLTLLPLVLTSKS